MMYRTFPILNKALRLIGQAPSLNRFTVEQNVLAPTETTEVPGVDMAQQDWNAITRFHHETTFEAEQARIEGGVRTHDATSQKVVRSVLATPYGCYAPGRSFVQSQVVPVSKLVTSSISHHQDGFHALPAIAKMYFGHWVSDSLPLALLARPDQSLYLPVPDAWPHASEYIRMLGLKPVSTHFATFKRLTVVQDVGMNMNRMSRISEIRDRLHDAVPKSSDRPGVVIRRGTTGASRELLNEDALCDRLSARGYSVCHATDPLAKIAQACRGAQFVVTMEGSQAVHGLMFADPGARIVIINPADRFNAVWADYMPAFGHHMATLVAPREGEGYLVDLDRLDALL